MVEQLILIGFIVAIIGILLIIVGNILSTIKYKDKFSFAFGGFIGPIPFGFANRKELLYLIIALSVILIIAFLILGRKI